MDAVLAYAAFQYPFFRGNERNWLPDALCTPISGSHEHPLQFVVAERPAIGEFKEDAISHEASPSGYSLAKPLFDFRFDPADTTDPEFHSSGKGPGFFKSPEMHW
jgi:hypothetical protein